MCFSAFTHRKSRSQDNRVKLADFGQPPRKSLCWSPSAGATNAGWQAGHREWIVLMALCAAHPFASSGLVVVHRELRRRLAEERAANLVLSNKVQQLQKSALQTAEIGVQTGTQIKSQRREIAVSKPKPLLALVPNSGRSQ